MSQHAVPCPGCTYSGQPHLTTCDQARKLKGYGSFMDVLNYAAKYLPEGYHIEIGVEHGSGWVNLYRCQVQQEELSPDLTLEEQVVWYTRIAKEEAEKP